MTLTVIEHALEVSTDRFAEWFAQLPEPIDVEIVRLWDGDDVPTVGDCGDGLLVLGGHGDVYDEAVTPRAADTRNLLVGAVEAGLPTLGICLGAQMLAVAAGGQVQVGAPPGREWGVVDIRLRPEIDSDALFSVFTDAPGRARRMPSMHADAVVTLPPDARWLAASRQYPYQAFRVGSSAWGVQFHPEASEATLVAWAEELDDVDADAVAAQMREHADEVEANGRALATRFAGIVAGGVVNEPVG